MGAILCGFQSARLMALADQGELGFLRIKPPVENQLARLLRIN
jgi:hypothetical protein